MAKDNNEFVYGAQYIPSGESKSRVIRWNFGGLNLTNDIDTGQLTGASGVIVDPPEIKAVLKQKEYKTYTEPISIHGFGDVLLVIYRSGGKIKADYIKPGNIKYTGEIGTAKGTGEDFTERYAVQFNVASNTENIAASTYVRKILIYPDRVSMDFNITSDFQTASLGETDPPIKYASVYCSRLFGVNDDLVYASSFNNYADFDLDTADESSSANAWVSMSQSNVKADGRFTAIATYANHVVLFKKDFMQLVYNNKNPFRIVDVGSYGCDNPYALTECGGVLYFASGESVYSFTGGTPKKINGELGRLNLDGAVFGSYKDRVYMQISDGLYTYKSGVWSKLNSDNNIKQFATTSWGIVALCKDGKIRIIDYDEDAFDNAGGNAENELGGKEYENDWWFETDFFAAGRIDVRRIKKVSVLCDIASGASVRAYLMRPEDKYTTTTKAVLESTVGGRRLMRRMIRMTSCYMHKMRIAGSGDVKILAIELLLSWGGDVFKNE